MTQDVNVFLYNFPNNGREMVIENEDGSYTILINSKLSDVGREEALKHAIGHIENNDFEKNSVQEIEFDAHNMEIVEEIQPTISPEIMERIKRIQRERRKINRLKRENQSKVDFMANNNVDFFSLAERNFLMSE